MKKPKIQANFTFADGRLEVVGMADIKCELCKECVKFYNDKNYKRKSGDNYKYLD